MLYIVCDEVRELEWTCELPWSITSSAVAGPYGCGEVQNLTSIMKIIIYNLD